MTRLRRLVLLAVTLFITCKEIVVDEFSGRTGCQINDWGTCGAGLGDGCLGCEPEVIISSAPCSWTDRPASSLL